MICMLSKRTDVGAMTRAGNAPTQQSGPSAPQRSERPKPAKTSSEQALSQVLDDGPTSEAKAPMGMAAPRAGGHSNILPTNTKPKKNEEEDDFADTDVSDLLG